MKTAAATRVKFARPEDAARLVTPAFCEYLVLLHDTLGARALELRARRAEILRAALNQHVMPGHPPVSAANTGDWRVPAVPDELRKPGIEISGPCSITPMFINALNPGPEGERAEGDLDDDEDSGGHRLIDTVRAAHNRLAAVNRELTFEDRERGKSYRIAPGELPVFMHRERGLHLDDAVVAICLKRGAVPIGGMATALPSNDPEVNRTAGEAIQKDKEWEAAQGFIRAWVAHIFHMKTAADPFKKLIGSGWTPTPEMAKPENYPVKIGVPAGPVTVEGTRRNARMLIEYVEGWLNGRGAKGIDSLEGKPGVHPALMEDLATGRMSVAQIAQRIRHHAKDPQAGVAHDGALVKRLLQEELADILSRRPKSAEVETRYRNAMKVAMRWVKNYTELDFRSLGAYTRAELDAIARAPGALLSVSGPRRPLRGRGSTARRRRRSSGP